jgi:hypothetical protein
MPHMTARLLAGFVSLALASGVALAQTPPPPPTQTPSAPQAATPAPAAPTAKAKSAKAAKTTRSPESLACSAEADARKLKGNPRKKFRKACLAEKRKAQTKS